ncbi:MAG: prolyl oligopeptidase family serine peptidase [Bacillota bacterium]|nr:prolyl oligopeptidase family serine peptidase [Bacillota bacterium]
MHKPTITETISLQVPVRSEISPDGRRVAYTVRHTDWNKNLYESVCYVHDTGAWSGRETQGRGRSCQLTRSGDATEFHWIGDESLAVLKTDGSESGKPQVWLLENLVGEGIQLTDHKTGVQSFRPFAGGILYLADDPEKSERKARKDRFGSVVHFEQEDSASALYYTSFEALKEYRRRLLGCTEDEAKSLVKPVVELSCALKEPLKILSFIVTPDGRDIYLNCQVRDDLVYYDESSVYRLRLDVDAALSEHMRRAADKDGDTGKSCGYDASGSACNLGELKRVPLATGATVQGVSPDGTQLLIRHKERDNMMFTLDDLWVLDLAAVGEQIDSDALLAHMKNVSRNLDRDLYWAEWVPAGLFVSYADGTRIRIARLGLDGTVQAIDFDRVFPYSMGFHVSQSGHITITGAARASYPEVYVSSEPLAAGMTAGGPQCATATAGATGTRSTMCNLRKLTSLGDQVAGWDLGANETIRWRSKDGTEIEGVLRKPDGFNPHKKYPLVFVVHGGPRGSAVEYLIERTDTSYYPGVQFANKDILVLKPNYRGSAGYGQAFTELNKDNLGVGDLWDLEGAIDHLDSLGFVDTARVGCMGWSQGGYISAFATTHSDRFRATSVGAGISNWYTYHIANDIPQFTTQYLSGTPFRSPDIYTKTSPISKIGQAKTPTLIQHGGKDQRVPPANATELYRGLKDMGVPVELFFFPEMGHPITKPRENRAVMHQNLSWFCHHLLGEKLDFEV